MNLVERILTPSEDALELVSRMFVISVSVSRENPLDFYGKKVVGCICMDLFDNQLTALHIVGHSWKKLYSR